MDGTKALPTAAAVGSGDNDREHKQRELAWKFERLTPQQQNLVLALADKLRESADRRRA